MEKMRIPKFENETDEANWLYENRESLAMEFLRSAQKGQVRHGTLNERSITLASTVQMAPESGHVLHAD
jgi:hypothetical protein